MKPSDLEDNPDYRLFKTLEYKDISSFVLETLSAATLPIITFWSLCAAGLLLALVVILNIGGYFSFGTILLHALAGLILFPILLTPVHELLHVIPYVAGGARNIRFGFEPGQYIFYVTAHRYVTGKLQFMAVALSPCIAITGVLLWSVLFFQGPWKWSLSLTLFVHLTMCAGDFALIELMMGRTGGKVYTWDDADKRVAYFYEESEKQ